MENINNSITIYYAIGNKLVEGDFNEVPIEAFYARIVQKLPYIDINFEYKIQEISYIIFLGTYIENGKIQVFNFNYGEPYIFYFYTNKDDIVCTSYEEFTAKILEFKEKHDKLNSNIYVLKKEKR